MTNIKKVVTTRFDRALPKLLAYGGLVGLLASFILTVEKIELIKDPSFQPSCNLNPIISCGSVMATPQAELFGFPNSLLGILGFTAVSVTGFALLAGATFKRWYWLALNFGLLLAVMFVHWLFFQTVYRINALCPYCMVVWVMVIPMFWYTTLYNLRKGFIPVSAKARSAVNFVQRHHADILFVWFLILFLAIMNHFWYFWKTLI